LETETIFIGAQEWMNQNLNIAVFRNGQEIYHADTDEKWEYAAKHQWPAWCSYENNELLAGIFGKLYNFYAVTHIDHLAPIGYRVPSARDWFELAQHLGGLEIAGKYLKSEDFWDFQDISPEPTKFNGFPGGLRYPHGTFDLANSHGFWWTTTESDLHNGTGINLYYDDLLLLKRPYFKGNGFSVRCIKSAEPF
jgi:uncharacterized protein (TIGR02145 family)